MKYERKRNKFFFASVYTYIRAYAHARENFCIKVVRKLY